MRTLASRTALLALLAAYAMTAGRPVRPAGGAGEIALSVDVHQRLGPISPSIYGMANATSTHMSELRVPLNRWGGNPSTRYNWKRGNSWNAARDWHFANGNYGCASADCRRPSGAADQAIATARAHRCDVLLTIPTLGWVARDDDPAHRSLDVPDHGGAPVSPGSEAIAGYDPGANRLRVSVPSLPRKGQPFQDPPDPTDRRVYQDEWVYHLTRRFGRANAGGVRYYAMDNEPDLWDVTQTDMHPVRADYDEILNRFLTYADAIKDVDPTAQVTGPVSWGWSGYFFSARDQGDDRYATHADRRAHGGMALLPWFLRQAAAHDARTGRRTLDLLDVHFYPQAAGVYAGNDDPATDALRLRSTRALWDPDYRDESWIGAAVQLLPRLRHWVNSEYPGVKIGLTEWNWGAERTLNGGLAAAEVLGILGRERIDLACYWTAPPIGSPTYYAYKIYRNADGSGRGFGDMAVAAASADDARVSCYGAIDTPTGAVTAMLINKSTAAQPVRLTLSGAHRMTSVSLFRYSGEAPRAVVRLPDTHITGRQLALLLPASSITLLRGL